MLDLLFGMDAWCGFRAEERERIEGVVGAERPSM